MQKDTEMNDFCVILTQYQSLAKQ